MPATCPRIVRAWAIMGVLSAACGSDSPASVDDPEPSVGEVDPRGDDYSPAGRSESPVGEDSVGDDDSPGSAEGSGYARFREQLPTMYCTWLAACGSDEPVESCVDLVTSVAPDCPAAALFYQENRAGLDACIDEPSTVCTSGDDFKHFCPATADFDWETCQPRSGVTPSPAVDPNPTPTPTSGSVFSYRISGDSQETEYRSGDPSVAHINASVADGELFVIFTKTNGEEFMLVAKGTSPDTYSGSRFQATRVSSTDTIYTSVSASGPNMLTLSAIGGVGGLVTGTFATSVKRPSCQSCSNYTYYGSFSIVRGS